MIISPWPNVLASVYVVDVCVLIPSVVGTSTGASTTTLSTFAAAGSSPSARRSLIVATFPAIETSFANVSPSALSVPALF